MVEIRGDFDFYSSFFPMEQVATKISESTRHLIYGGVVAPELGNNTRLGLHLGGGQAGAAGVVKTVDL